MKSISTFVPVQFVYFGGAISAMMNGTQTHDDDEEDESCDWETEKYMETTSTNNNSNERTIVNRWCEHCNHGDDRSPPKYPRRSSSLRDHENDVGLWCNKSCSCSKGTLLVGSSHSGKTDCPPRIPRRMLQEATRR